MPFGRPTKCTPEVIKKAYDYLKNFADYGDNFPSMEGLGDELDVDIRTLERWHKDKENEFSYILTRLKTRQARTLLHKSGGTIPIAIGKMVLGNHGYFEKTATEISGPGGTSIHHTDLSKVDEDELDRRLALKEAHLEQSEVE